MPPPYGRGWSDIGYHWVVRRSGAVEGGRQYDGDSILEGKEIGAHVKGHNSDSLAICIVGRREFATNQLQSTLVLAMVLMALHHVPLEQVYGHYELDPKKTCPNLDMKVFREKLAKMLEGHGVAA